MGQYQSNLDRLLYNQNQETIQIILIHQYSIVWISQEHIDFMGQYLTKIKDAPNASLAHKITQASSTVSREKQWLFLRIILVIADILVVGISFRLAYWIRFEIPMGIFNEDAIIDIEYYQMLVLILNLEKYLVL